MVIQIENTTGVPFLLFLLLYWHVLSHLILPLETHIIYSNRKYNRRAIFTISIIVLARALSFNLTLGNTYHF